MESIFDGHDDIDIQDPPRPSSSGDQPAEIPKEEVKADDTAEQHRLAQPADDNHVAGAQPSDAKAAVVRCSSTCEYLLMYSSQQTNRRDRRSLRRCVLSSASCRSRSDTHTPARSRLLIASENVDGVLMHDNLLQLADITQIKTLSRNVMFETAVDEADREALMASMEPVRILLIITRTLHL